MAAVSDKSDLYGHCGCAVFSAWALYFTQLPISICHQRPSLLLCPSAGPAVAQCDRFCSCRITTLPPLSHALRTTAPHADATTFLLCSECLEVKCRDEPSLRTGNKNEKPLDRSKLCATDASVKVKITDTCPCEYPGASPS